MTGHKELRKEDKGSSTQVMKIPLVPRYEGGNLVVDLDEEAYLKVIEELKHSIVGRLFLQRWCFLPKTIELKKKLMDDWGIKIES